MKKKTNDNKFLKQYLPMIIISFLSFFFIYFTSFIIKDSIKFVTIDNNKIDDYLIKYFEEDFENKFTHEDFYQLYKDINYLIQINKISIDNNKSINSQFADARKNNKYTNNMQSFENGSFFRVIGKLNRRIKEISAYYIHPINTTVDVYLYLDIKERLIFAIDKEKFQKLDNKLISFDITGINIKVDKKEVLEHYNKSLKYLLDISSIYQLDIQDILQNKIDKILFFNAILSFFIILSMTMIIYFRFKDDKQLYSKLEKDQKRLEQQKKDVQLKNNRLNQIEHLMQHDVKTNIDERLNYLSSIYNSIEDNTENENIFLSMYSLDLTIKLANDFLRQDKISVPHFYRNLQTENIFKFANGKLETYGDIGTKILENIIIIKIDDIDDIDDFPVRDFYQNEFSSLLFRLINNALKHSNDKKVFIDIKKDKNKNLKITIKNNVKSLEKSLYEIKTSLELKDNVKNVTIVYNQIKRFGMQLDYVSSENGNSIIAEITKDRNA